MALHGEENGVVLTIHDDGLGFDPEVVATQRTARGTSGGFGLIGIRERAQLMGGTSDIWSDRGAGTRIVVRVPVNWYTDAREYCAQGDGSERIMAETAIKVLVCDDHPIVREGIVAILETQTDIEVIGEVSDGSEAVTRVAQGGVDVVLMDLAMAQMDGAEATRRIRALDQPARVLVLTAFDTDERILEAVQAGAQGYLLKGAKPAEIFDAVRVVHSGGSLLQPAVANSLLRALNSASKAAATPAPTGPAIEPLTEREREVLVLIAKGLRNKEIADTLFISERTVKFHANALYQKLNVTSRTEAVSFALQHRLITLDETTT